MDILGYLCYYYANQFLASFVQICQILLPWQPGSAEADFDIIYLLDLENSQLDAGIFEIFHTHAEL